MVHLQPEPGQAPQDNGRSHCRGRKAGISVDNVRLSTLKPHDSSGSKDASPDIRSDPVSMFITGPAVNEQADGYQDRSWNHQRDTEFGPPHIVVPLLQLAVDAVIDGRTDLGSEEKSQSQGDIVEATNASRFMVDLRPDRGESG